GIRPEILLDILARRCRGDERSRDLVDGHSEQSGPLAVHVHLNRRIVELLLDMEVPKRRDLSELSPNLLGHFSIRRDIGAADRDLDWRWGTEAQDAAHDIARLEGDLNLRDPPRDRAPQALAELVHTDLAAVTQLDLKDSLVRPAGPEVNRVQRMVRRLCAD